MLGDIVIRLQLENRPGTLARALQCIASFGIGIEAVDLVSSTTSVKVRDISMTVPQPLSSEELEHALNALPGVTVVHVSDRVFLAHLGGKIEISPKRPIVNRADLSLIYTPGVAKVCTAIAQDPFAAFNLTLKNDTVAVVTDGSAILGLGNLGPLAALPVMEGKAALFKRFGNVNAVPICLDTQDPQAIIETVERIAPAFGGINLEDIAAPKCFVIEQTLQERLKIPVFHDDQHGTAIVVLAALRNALRIVGKSLSQVRIVISGAGAAGYAIARLLHESGAEEIIVCDRTGALAAGVPQPSPQKRWMAEELNPRQLRGSLREVLHGADVFIGVSAGGLLNRDDIRTMAAKPIVFALANPIPEVMPQEIADLGAVVATGRSDFPNQINNVLAFPGVFAGALRSRATTINAEMMRAASEALADGVAPEELSPEFIIPSVFDTHVQEQIAQATEEAARRTGVAQRDGSVQ
ncbi:MAG: NAD-dependent malic enzyme [Firmicutes bacterium]|nr:NAD-dependent malic enzyme [Bacillota bacterium]